MIEAVILTARPNAFVPIARDEVREERVTRVNVLSPSWTTATTAPWRLQLRVDQNVLPVAYPANA